ncbi:MULTISPECIES: glycosyltransferase [unclassified Thermotoga]|uniref:CgeB family protein n=1 Tax=unclassified Thermotoga TaxID=2631113 RepID=UPI000280E6BB|nr:MULTISPECIES: glycosyltransferase [unclassified Thermotoga]AIY85855.1 hypothetical protein T2812B_01520 [Thermotoga sp. 2812B]EJX26859.1 hypothetical protein EMP_01252 [Thermotoga sp. EMP]KHC90356.1 hypothetical protein Mc24_08349 [Thermotoga sp. Mc24]
MKVAVVGKFTTEEMGYHILYTLRKIGYDAYGIEFGPKVHADRNFMRMFRTYRRKLFEIGINTIRTVRKVLLKHILNHISELKEIDLIISTYDYFTYEEIREIKKTTKATIVLWFPDAVSNFGRGYFMTAGYDFMFFKDPYVVRYLREFYGFKNVFYLPEAFNPDLHKVPKYDPKDEESYGCDISVVANLHSFRVPILEKLVSTGKYSIKIYGSPPPYYVNTSNQLLGIYTGRYLANEEKAKAWRYAKISLNTLHPGEIESVNVRVFEITGAGGFLLTPYRKCLEDLFVIGEEIEVYYSLNDMIDKIDHYLKNSEKREKIREKGQKRALMEHTYEQRLRTMLEIIEKGGHE